MKPPSSRATIMHLSLSSDQILEARCNNVTDLLQGDQIMRVNSTDLSNATQVVFNFPSIFNYFQFLAIWCHCQSFSRTELWRCWRLWQGKSRWRWRGWSSSRWRSRRTRWRSRKQGGEEGGQGGEVGGQGGEVGVQGGEEGEGGEVRGLEEMISSRLAE